MGTTALSILSIQEPHWVIKLSSSLFPGPERLQSPWKQCHGPSSQTGSQLKPAMWKSLLFCLYWLPSRCLWKGVVGHPCQPGADHSGSQRIIWGERTICWTQIQSSAHLNLSGIASLSTGTVAHFQLKSTLWNLNHRNAHHHKKALWALLTKQTELLPRAEE